eukprot:jgi/Mesen1/5050/ME000252S04166
MSTVDSSIAVHSEVTKGGKSITELYEIKYSPGPGPVLKYKETSQVKKGEDFSLIEAQCRRGEMSFSLFCVFDGHNGTSAAVHTKKNLLDLVEKHLPTGGDKDAWLKALPMALAEAFVTLNNDFWKSGRSARTYDSRASAVSQTPEKSSARGAATFSVPRSGGRIIMASDGLWDAVDNDRAAKLCRGLPASTAASALVKESIKVKGLRDDITVIVVDLLPAGTSAADSSACAVPKSKKEKTGLLQKLKGMKSKKGGDAKAPAPVEDMPNLVNDHDSMKGGSLYERYLLEGRSVHSGGHFCQVCGKQVQMAGSYSEASIRAGNIFCSLHMDAGNASAG